MTKKTNTKSIAEISMLIDLSERMSVLNWCANQGEELKIEVMQRHASLIRQRRTPGESITAEMSYSLLLLAAKQIRIEMSGLALKRDLSVAQTEELSRKRIEGFRKPKKRKGSNKLNRLRKDFFALIILLKENQKYSWSEIIDYLRHNHQFDVSKAYIQVAYNKLRIEVSHE